MTAKVYSFQSYKSSRLLCGAARQAKQLNACYQNIEKSYEVMEQGLTGFVDILESSTVSYAEMRSELNRHQDLYQRCEAAMEEGSPEDMESLAIELKKLSSGRY